jgi:hypothetical protein
MITSSDLPSFDSREAAQEWMETTLGEDCMDNYRFAYVDDAAAMTSYAEQSAQGCCGSFDKDIIVAGRLAMIGCNFGH